jgi:L-threonylcarbamoyladenylate synthase
LPSGFEELASVAPSMFSFGRTADDDCGRGSGEVEVMVTRDLPEERVNRGGFVLPKDIDETVAALRAGELVVFPTETFYAIGADPSQPDALAAIVRVKGRQPEKPIALLASDIVSAFQIARAIPPCASVLAETFWPGPLTLVLPARPGLNDVLIGPGGGIGVRVSPHPAARALAREIGGLITATSANLSGESPARSVAEARKSLGTQISVYLDGGVLSSNAPSTVIELMEEDGFRIVRPGVIDHHTIAAALRSRR